MGSEHPVAHLAPDLVPNGIREVVIYGIPDPYGNLRLYLTFSGILNAPGDFHGVTFQSAKRVKCHPSPRFLIGDIGMRYLDGENIPPVVYGKDFHILRPHHYRAWAGHIIQVVSVADEA